jgi:NADPH:quinone reductase
MTTVNRQIRLAARPVGLPKVSDFQLSFSALPTPVHGQVLLRSVYLSLDPYMRGRMNDTAAAATRVAIGEVMAGGAVGLVMVSEDPRFHAGDVVEGMFGWQEYAVAPGNELRRVDTSLAPMSTALGVLGMPGLTAFFGLLDICAPQPGETFVVSAAAGAVGMLAGQIAKIKGCRVVGVAGSDAKISWLLEELGIDAAFNYRASACCDRELRAACPDGIDIYFDNVGGSVTDAVLRHININARIAVCGQLSQYNLETPELGPRWLEQIVVKQAKLQGFLVSAYAARFTQGRRQLASWLQQGKLRYREDVAQGIEAAPQAFIGMLQGKNQGKQLVQLSES